MAGCVATEQGWGVEVRRGVRRRYVGESVVLSSTNERHDSHLQRVVVVST